MGSTFDCAVHSKSVCFFESAIISSPVIVPSVSVAIRPPHQCTTTEVTDTNGVTPLSCTKKISGSPFVSVSTVVVPLRPALQHCLTFCSELVPRSRLRHLVRLRDPVADREQQLEILRSAA